jgi:hypothetical protein
MPFVVREHSFEESGTPEALFRSLRRDKNGPQYLSAVSRAGADVSGTLISVRPTRE